MPQNKTAPSAGAGPVWTLGEDAFWGCPALTLVVTRDSYAARYGEENGLNCAYTDAPDRLAD